jgi:hypothetical protein
MAFGISAGVGGINSTEPYFTKVAKRGLAKSEIISNLYLCSQVALLYSI